MKGYREENRTKIAERSKERRQHWRKAAIDYLGGKCVDCGNKDQRVLEFDHLRDKTRNVSWFMDRNWELLFEELEKCELVCANCHVVRTYKRTNNGSLNS